MKKVYLVILLLVILIIGFVSGLFTNNIFYQKSILDCHKNYCYSLGQEYIKQIITEKFPANDAVGVTQAQRNFINGKVREVRSNIVIVDYKGFEIIPDQNLMVREVQLDDNTEIEKLVKKDDKIYQEELNNYKNSQDQNQIFSPENYPGQYSYVKSSFNELKVGQDVYIESDKNIQDQKTFHAKLIKIL